MLVGVVAFNVLRVIPATDPRAIGVLLVGYVFQGGYSRIPLARSCSSLATRPGVLHDILLHLHLHYPVSAYAYARYDDD